jgi:hypothetical protein
MRYTLKRKNNALPNENDGLYYFAGGQICIIYTALLAS